MGTGNRVLAHIAGDYTLYFSPESVRTRETSDGILDESVIANLNARLLIYDIPEASDFPNPSGVLRRVAVRINLSCWVIPEHLIPYELLGRMAEAGASWHTVKFDSTEGKKLVTMAVNSLRQELADAVRRSETARDGAERQLGESTESRERAEARYLRRAEGIAERYNGLAADLVAAARVFGISATALQLDAATTAVDAISAGMHERARQYLRANQTLQAAGMGTFTPDCPAGILADVLADVGFEGQALQLQEAFAGAAGSGVPAGDDETFSLVDGK
jgi:hypothetical protein